MNKRICFLLTAMLLALLSGTCVLAETLPNPLTLNSECDYTIIYASDSGSLTMNACRALKDYLNLPASSDQSTAIGQYEILLGKTNRPESALFSDGLGEHDYRIVVQNNKLVLTGGSDTALLNAAAALLRDESLTSSDSENSLTIPADYSLFFDGADTRAEYVANPDLFLCNWALEFDVPVWMLDFEEKLASFKEYDGRMMSMHHRGDWYHYPENSIEGIISSIHMGADAVEIDLRLTRDNVVVLMHDETLDRTTDWADKAGKNGLPESNYVYDWTYEELCQLRLLSYLGTPTEYVIPTFREALHAANGRAVLFLDKSSAWDWNTDVYPLIEEMEAWQTCLITTFGIANQNKAIIDTIKADSDKDAVLIYGGFSLTNLHLWQERLNTMRQEGYDPIIVREDINCGAPRISIQQSSETLEQLKGNVRIFAFVHAIAGGKEKPITWDYLYENGVSFIAADNGLLLQQYIAENFGK